MMSRAALRQSIIEAFGSDELVTLCADLGVDADLIPGRDKGEAFWVDQLITYFERRNSIPALISKLRAERPNIDWAYAVSPSVIPQSAAAIPITWLVAAAGLAVLIVLAGIIVPKLNAAPAQTATSGATSEATSAPPTAMLTATATATAAPTRSPATAEKMPADHFNILFLDFGQLSASGVITSADGARLSLSAADTFKKYLQEAISAEVQFDFPPLVWHSGDAVQHGWQVGPVATIADAQRIAEQVGAQMVVYGNFAAPADASATNGQLEVGFYVARVANAADEIVGPYQLSSPIPVRWPMTADVENSTRLALNDRNRLLSRFALGLAYDLFGRPEQALNIFQNADATLPASYKVGREVLYFFIGREHLLLQQTQLAEDYHQKALALNSNYARAHLGLGDVNLQYAAAITEPAALLQSDNLRIAGEQYALAEQQATLTSDVPQLAQLARLGLGLVKQIQARAQYALGQRDDAQSALTDSLRLMEPALQILSQRPDGQRRTLALGYLSLGEANWTQARLTRDDAAGIQLRNAFYQKANAAYAACSALDVGTDPYLTENIIGLCTRNQRRMNAEVPE